MRHNLVIYYRGGKSKQGGNPHPFHIYFSGYMWPFNSTQFNKTLTDYSDALTPVTGFGRPQSHRPGTCRASATSFPEDLQLPQFFSPEFSLTLAQAKCKALLGTNIIWVS